MTELDWAGIVNLVLLVIVLLLAGAMRARGRNRTFHRPPPDTESPLLRMIYNPPPDPMPPRPKRAPVGPPRKKKRR